ncbi:TPA: hypothetical protein N0F65_012560 [Lagenidium giganteum]|uniref:Probable acetate kinase n=1 Tax=Lagenidium giganteum TaxID=4803 RepID=A0AAV2YNM8_9STRA|nr:TPA: hypothetical protein N0F65_012560 [Lagenidium giganteum]
MRRTSALASAAVAARSASSSSRLLVLNAGSSTLKYKMFGLHDGGVEAPIFSGLVELSNASSPDGRIVHQRVDSQEKQEVQLQLPTHRAALEQVVDRFFGGATDGIQAIGHRVVHGGESFHDATRIDARVLEAVNEHTCLAPLHNPGNLLGIAVATEVFGEQTPQVAVFDTAYHATMPPKAYIYGLPYHLYEQNQVRRYGFHGTSHQYVAKQAAKRINKPLEKSNFITCHLGNGSSMAAIRNGKCIDTTMGMTPLEGLLMGTRSGDVDPALHAFLTTQLKMTIEQVDKMLNKQSGLLGICGDSDIRKIQDRIREKNDPIANLAMDVYAHRVRKYLGAYLLELGGSLDALVFTAGIGESSAMIRERVCRNLDFLGIELDEEKNAVSMMGEGHVEIQSANSRIKVLVIPTDEERSIAEQTYDIALRQ